MSNGQVFDGKAATAGIIGFVVAIAAFNVVDAIYPLRPHISKSVGTAICFVIGYALPYAYVRYKNRYRGDRSP